MNRFGYFAREALRGLKQGRAMTLLSIMTISIALFFLGGLIIGHITIDRVLDEASSRAGLVIFLEDVASGDSLTVSKLRAALTAMPEVEQVTYIDKNEAWKRFELTYGSRMLEAVAENPFPASLEAVLVSAHRSVQSAREIGERLQGHAAVTGVTYSQEWLSRLERMRRYFLGGTAALFILTAIALNFIIANTIKLTIYARRELVVNMRYVGASDTYIQMPFIIEGMLQGLVGATMAFLLLSAGKLLLSQVPVVWGPPSSLFTVLLGVGVLFGWLGSRSAVRKFLV